ncbi:MAG: hypothetical protein U5K84_00010 [Alkalibacterium sp.]|nr:hypothetical protein [Alkalibacterium sp.]
MVHRQISIEPGGDSVVFSSSAAIPGNTMSINHVDRINQWSWRKL